MHGELTGRGVVRVPHTPAFLERPISLIGSLWLFPNTIGGPIDLSDVADRIVKPTTLFPFSPCIVASRFRAFVRSAKVIPKSSVVASQFLLAAPFCWLGGPSRILQRDRGLALVVSWLARLSLDLTRSVFERFRSPGSEPVLLRLGALPARARLCSSVQSTAVPLRLPYAANSRG